MMVTTVSCPSRTRAGGEGGGGSKPTRAIVAVNYRDRGQPRQDGLLLGSGCRGGGLRCDRRGQRRVRLLLASHHPYAPLGGGVWVDAALRRPGCQRGRSA